MAGNKDLFNRMLQVKEDGIKNTSQEELESIKKALKDTLSIEFQMMHFSYTPQGAICGPNKGSCFNLTFYHDEDQESNTKCSFFESDYVFSPLYTA